MFLKKKNIFKYHLGYYGKLTLRLNQKYIYFNLNYFIFRDTVEKVISKMCPSPRPLHFRFS